MRVHIDLAKWPEGKEELLEGRLNTFVCAKCGFSKVYDFVLFYEDRKNDLMVMSAPRDSEIELKPEYQDLAEKVRLRRVESRNQLIEKVVIDDSKLDDRVVEFLKLQIRGETLRMSHPIDGDLMFHSLRENDDGETVLEFQDFTGDKDDQFLQFRFEVYREVAKVLKPFMDQMPKPSSPWLWVDRKYAQDLERLVEAADEKQADGESPAPRNPRGRTD